jgi:geranylgeranyl pyrophosphate synthase
MSSILTSDGVRDSEKLKNRYIEKCRKIIKELPQTPYTGALSEIVEWL